MVLCYKLRMNRGRWFAIAALVSSLFGWTVRAGTTPWNLLTAMEQSPSQAPASPPGSTSPASEPRPEDEGIPVTDKLVRDSCGTCHKTDDKGLMTRVSFRRTTPEGWQQTIRRMVTLNGADLKPEQARAIVKYLSNHHGLAPEELKPAAFEIERRLIDYKYAADRDTEATCTKCHSMGRVLTERRSKEDWELLLAMHRGYYPLVDTQAFRRGGRQTQPGIDGRPPDNRHPMEKALAHLTAAYPLRTPEWATWSANMRPPQVEGQWVLSAYQPGHGPIFGHVAISRAPESDDEFVVETAMVFARTGQSVSRKGRAIVYTGFQWRGRSNEGSSTSEASAFREVMLVERDWKRMTGRWYRGAYDEIGMDVTLDREGRDPIMLGVTPTALKTGVTTPDVRLYGTNFPPTVGPGDVNFGQGVKVTRVVSASPTLVTVDVSVDAGAVVGLRDVFVAGSSRPSAVAVYDKIDGIKVVPQWGMARVGGVNFPKQLQQFEAVAYHNGADGKPETRDDVNLGIVDATWSIEEYTAVFGDDDRLFVGQIGATGLFTPSDDGPNPKRRNRANNIGDVYVVATYSPPDAGTAARPLRARAHLLVTVPLYMRWDPWQVTR